MNKRTESRHASLRKLTTIWLGTRPQASVLGALEIQAKLVADNVASIKLADTGHWR